MPATGQSVYRRLHRRQIAVCSVSCQHAASPILTIHFFKRVMNSKQPLPPGPLVIDVDGLILTAEDRELIAHPLTGGLVLFARNFHDRRQLTDLTRQIREARNGQILICVDQEGGRVQRFKDGFSLIPPMRLFGEHYDTEPGAAVSKLTEVATLLAWELRECDIDFSFAPVADLDRDLCPAIGNRALHPTAAGVRALATAVIDGFAAAGCSNVIKHFPGHGSVDVDTHKDFARDHRSFAEIEQTDMQTFALLKDKATAVMPAHVIFNQVDELPASLSPVWQSEILRGKLQFQGAIISDDLSMSAISKAMPQADAAAKAIAAGSDLALICNEREAAAAAFDHPDILVGSDDRINRRLSMAARRVAAPKDSTLAGARRTISSMVC